jgi:hypothetical protein
MLLKIELSCQIFEKSSTIIFDENLSSGIRVVPCGKRDRQTDRETDTDGQRDMT